MNISCMAAHHVDLGTPLATNADTFNGSGPVGFRLVNRWWSSRIGAIQFVARLVPGPMPLDHAAPCALAAVTMGAYPSGDAPWRNPITGIVGCCGRAASGHAAAAPPSSVMKSRRLLIRSPRRRGEA